MFDPPELSVLGVRRLPHFLFPSIPLALEWYIAEYDVRWLSCGLVPKL